MTGPKTNEGATAVGERTGTRASARYIRSSAYKAREVLDLIRGLDVQRADEVLQFTDRDISNVIRKVLASAVANAIHNDEQDAEDLYVRACYADEGPTLKRFRPRARGRASRIRKRTSHITIVVDRMTDEMLNRRQAKESARQQTGRAGRVTSSAAARRARVERSRQAAAAAATTEASTEATTTDALEASEVEADEVETTKVQGFAAVPAADADADEAVDADVTDEADADEAGPYGPGSAPATEDGSAPDGFDIKGNADSMLYHVPGSRFYEQTIAEVWFDSAESAEAAGFALPPSQREDADTATAGDEDTEENS